MVTSASWRAWDRGAKLEPVTVAAAAAPVTLRSWRRYSCSLRLCSCVTDDDDRVRTGSADWWGPGALPDGEGWLQQALFDLGVHTSFQSAHEELDPHAPHLRGGKIDGCQLRHHELRDTGRRDRDDGEISWNRLAQLADRAVDAAKSFGIERDDRRRPGVGSQQLARDASTILSGCRTREVTASDMMTGNRCAESRPGSHGGA